MTALLPLTRLQLLRLPANQNNPMRLDKLKPPCYCTLFALFLSLSSLSSANSHSATSTTLKIKKLEPPKAVRIAVAANFKAPLKALIGLFNQQDTAIARSIEFHISSGATGTLYTQIVHGAPFDVFLAADEKHPAQLVEQAIAHKPSLSNYTRGQLALAYPRPPDRNMHKKSGNNRNQNDSKGCHR